MSSFTFRQRAGRLNWKIVSSVNVDNVVESSDIVELQSVIDVVTFSEFTPVDVRGNTVEAISKLVNIMQLVIEYLLYCQESQCRLLQVMNERNSSLKKKCTSLKRELGALSEDNKIYQRQLQLLRHSLMKSQHMLGSPSSPKVVIGGSERHNDENDNQRENETKVVSALMDTVLKHERDNREFLRTLLDEQRSTFFAEMNKMTTKDTRSLDGKENDNSLAYKRMEDSMRDMTSRLCSQVESLLQTTITSMGDSSVKLLTALTAQQQQAAPHRESSRETRVTMEPITYAAPIAGSYVSSSNNEEQVQNLQLQLENSKKVIEDVKARNEQLVTEMKASEYDWDAERDQLKETIQRLSDQLRELSTGASEGAILARRTKQLSVKTICRFIANGQLRQQRMYFSHWIRIVSDDRLAKQQFEHSRLLRHATTSQQQKEQELRTLLRQERERAESLQEQLRQQQEIVRALPQQKLRVDCGVNTERGTDSTLAMASVDRAYLSLSGDALMQRAAERVASHYRQPDEMAVMNELAAEITHRLGSM